jgi:hypothetical protein
MIIKKGEPKFNALRDIVSAGGPQYRKHAVIVTIGTSAELHGTYWDGGSRSSYALVDTRRIGTIRTFPQYAPPQFGGPSEPVRVDIRPGQALQERGTFCGKPATASLTMSQSDFDAVPE